MPVRWPVAAAIVLTGAFVLWHSHTLPASTADGTAGTGGTGGTGGAGGPGITISFVNSEGVSLNDLALGETGSSAEFFVAAQGMTTGGHDTVQLLIQHDPAVTEVTTAVCSGVFDGAFSPPGPVVISPGQVAFECGLQGGVASASGIVAAFTLRRLADGNDELELITAGPFGTRLFSAGSPSQIEPGQTLPVVEPPAPAPTASPTATATPPASANSGSGNGFSAPLPVPTTAFFAPGVLSGLQATAGDGRVLLSWQPPLDDGGAGITQYVVRSADGEINLTVPADLQPVPMTGLVNGREYRFRVRAVNRVGAGPFSELTGSVVPAGPPSAPLDVTARLIEATSEIVVSWSPPENTNGAETESYTVAEAAGLVESVRVSADVSSHTFGQIVPGEYLFAVAATNRGGMGPAVNAAVTAPGPTGESPSPAIVEAPVDVVLVPLTSPLTGDERLELAAGLTAATGDAVEVTGEPLMVTTHRGQLRVVLPVSLTGIPAPPAEFTGFNAGGLSVAPEGGLPAAARLDFGNGLTISGNVSINADGGDVTADLSSMVLLFSPPVPPLPGSDPPLADRPLFTAPIGDLSGIPAVSAIYFERVGPPHLPSADRLRNILLNDGWPEFGEFPVIALGINIEHPGSSTYALGDTTLSFDLVAAVEPGSLLIAVKQDDAGAIHSRPVSCETAPAGRLTCATTFDGPARGFSTFAVLLVTPLATPAAETGTGTFAVQTEPPPVIESPTPLSPTGLTGTASAVISPSTVPSPERLQSLAVAAAPTASPPPLPPAPGLPSQIENDDRNSILVVIVLGSVFGIAGLGVAGYLVNRRHGLPLTMLLATATAAATLTLITSVPAGHLSRPAAAAGPAGGEGDVAQRSSDLREAFGVDGTGVTIGIIADSFGCDAAALAAEIAAGELPADITIFQDTPSFFCPFTSDRGRTMAQLIHDVAPGADLMFQTGVFGQASVSAAIPLMAAAGADIIVDDISFDGELQFQDGLLAQAIDQVTAAGTLYFMGAGDNGVSAYEAEFSDGGTAGAECSTSAPVICTASGVRHDFDPGPGVDRFLDISLPAGATTLVLGWEQPGLSAGGTGNSVSANLFIYDAAGVPIAVSAHQNTLPGDPVEVVDVSGHTSVMVSVSHRSGPAPGRIRLLASDGAIISEHQTDSGTVAGRSNAAGAITIGSVHYTDTAAFGGTPVVEPQSSRGGVGILFAPDGTRLSSPVLRQKPDLVAPSGAATTLGPVGGTAAAAAHAAGAAALLLELRPDLRATGALGPEQVRWLLTRTAVDIGAAGPDRESGYGLLDAMEAAVTLIFEPPIAAQDEFSVDMNAVLFAPAPGLLANDFDLNGHVLEPILLAGPENGSLILSADGSFTYTPDPGFVGGDSFTYRGTDGVFVSEPAAVTITVLGIESVSVEVRLQGVGPDADFGADRLLLLVEDAETFQPALFDPHAAGPSISTGLSPGNYTLTAHVPGFLYAMRSGVVLGAVPGAQVVVPPVRLLAGDATGDGVIDATDAGVMTGSFGTAFAPGERRDGAGDIADMNGDGVNSGADLSLTLSNLGLTAPAPWE